ARTVSSSASSPISCLSRLSASQSSIRKCRPNAFILSPPPQNGRRDRGADPIHRVFRCCEVKLVRLEAARTHPFFHHEARALLDLFRRLFQTVRLHEHATARRPSHPDARCAALAVNGAALDGVGLG